MNVGKGQEYVSVFADLVAKRVLFATEGKDKATWPAFVEALGKHNGHETSFALALHVVGPAPRFFQNRPEFITTPARQHLEWK